MKNNMSKLIALVICVFGLSLILSGCGSNKQKTENNKQKTMTSIQKTKQAPKGVTGNATSNKLHNAGDIDNTSTKN
jgi:protein involved in sex pheromone biosynthesis